MKNLSLNFVLFSSSSFLILLKGFCIFFYFHHQQKKEFYTIMENEMTNTIQVLQHELHLIASGLYDMIEVADLNEIDDTKEEIDKAVNTIMNHEKIIGIEVELNSRSIIKYKEAVISENEISFNKNTKELYFWIKYDNIKICIKINLIELIAKYHDIDLIFCNKNGDVILSTQNNLPHAMYSNIKKNFTNLNKSKKKYGHNFEYFDQLNDDVYIYVIYSTKNLIAKLQNLRNEILIFIIFFTIFAYLLSVLISRKIYESITFIKSNIKNIRNLNFQNTEFNQSINFEETNEIIQEIQLAKNALQNIKKFIPSNIAKSIIDNNINVNNYCYQRNATIIFTDIRGYTAMIEKNICLKQVFQDISFYFKKIETIFNKYDGILDKYIGDSAMSFWHNENHANIACICALEIAKLFESSEFITNIGISTGESSIGNIGSDNRMQYTIISKFVNYASRIENLNKIYGTKVLIHHSTYLEADKILTRPIDIVKLKGSSSCSLVHEAMDLIENNNKELKEKCDITKKAFDLYNAGNFKESLNFYKLLNDSVGFYWVTKIQNIINNID